MNILQKLYKPLHVVQSNMIYDNNTNNTNNNIFCVNCGIQGHVFKFCKMPVCSYGLICFYKQKTMVKETPIVNNIFNRKTKKTEYSLRSKNRKYNNANINNISRIKILKRHESISYTLKNMLGVVGGNSEDQEAIDGILDTNEVEEIIDIDDEYDNSNINEKKFANNDEINLDKMKEVMINKILLVQRRNTIGFIEFMRGKYAINNKLYIGKTITTFKNRKQQHLRHAFNYNSQTHFHRALRKYGKESFEWSIIKQCENEKELNETEIFYIDNFIILNIYYVINKSSIIFNFFIINIKYIVLFF